MDNCIFCKIAAKQIPASIVYEDEDLLAFKDINPAAPVHLLLIPKRHVASLSDCDDSHADMLGKLLRLADRVVFSFDGDAAGRRAAWRALENALPLLSDTKQLDFLFLPPEHDPDSFVRAEGLEAFEVCVRDALPLSSFLLKELAQRADITTPEGRARMQAELKPLVQQMPDIALRTQIASMRGDEPVGPSNIY